MCDSLDKIKKEKNISSHVEIKRISSSTIIFVT